MRSLATDLSGFALFPLYCTAPGKSQNSDALCKPIQRNSAAALRFAIMIAATKSKSA